jgi:hypothetical protein
MTLFLSENSRVLLKKSVSSRRNQLTGYGRVVRGDREGGLTRRAGFEGRAVFQIELIPATVDFTLGPDGEDVGTPVPLRGARAGL